MLGCATLYTAAVLFTKWIYSLHLFSFVRLRNLEPKPTEAHSTVM